MTRSDEPTPMESVGERYVLIELVHADDDHEVWRAHDDLAGRPVAVARYRATTAEWRAGFDRRARGLEAITDPGIASTLRHDADDDPPWLATAWIDGETVAAIRDDAGFTADDALAVVGQAALALAAAHGAGVGHGSLDAEHVMVRPDGSVALVGFAVSADPTPAGDLAGLAALARNLLGDQPADAETARFVGWLADPDATAAEIGRTALALAVAHRADEPTTSIVARTDESPGEAPRPWYDEDERKRVRNRLIALGAIVVIAGAVLMRIFSAGAGQATVPPVVGLPFVQAQHQLNEVGLRAAETDTTGPAGTSGTVIAQDPPGGTRVKVGALVHLTVATASR